MSLKTCSAASKSKTYPRHHFKHSASQAKTINKSELEFLCLSVTFVAKRSVSVETLKSYQQKLVVQLTILLTRHFVSDPSGKQTGCIRGARIICSESSDSCELCLIINITFKFSFGKSAKRSESSLCVCGMNVSDPLGTWSLVNRNDTLNEVTSTP